MFIIEDIKGNKFGGYVDNYNSSVDRWCSDIKTFVFTLKSSGRNNGMKKFSINSELYLFYLGSGYDIGIRKKNDNNLFTN